MQKHIITQDAQVGLFLEQNWLDLEKLAQIELTSENASHPIELALKPDEEMGWQASEPGPQTIRLLFDKPLWIRHVRLVFDENDQERTQEFVLRWSSNCGQSYLEIVRQQYNFCPPYNVREIEEYAVDLVGLTTLELSIVPDISR